MDILIIEFSVFKSLACLCSRIITGSNLGENLATQHFVIYVFTFVYFVDNYCLYY